MARRERPWDRCWGPCDLRGAQAAPGTWAAGGLFERWQAGAKEGSRSLRPNHQRLGRPACPRTPDPGAWTLGQGLGKEPRFRSGMEGHPCHPASVICVSAHEGCGSVWGLHWPPLWPWGLPASSRLLLVKTAFCFSFLLSLNRHDIKFTFLAIFKGTVGQH